MLFSIFLAMLPSAFFAGSTFLDHADVMTATANSAATVNLAFMNPPLGLFCELFCNFYSFMSNMPLLLFWFY
jgi:hypothetical protein